jgi:hypothetical protein
MDLKITERGALALGFKLDKRYEHDEWETYRYIKGCLLLEFTYHIENMTLETIDVTIDEVVGLEVDELEVYQLDKILNKCLK